ncbi:LysR family transcriptional regulator [Anianabacter salinae]|uniref:LysR family transcriptional regulator n=1 Tax=Anianabacter salinae TaxID=2851023 RepID=UPI00225E3ADF|nr:LysR family transcriptional regulator [Anianabacter salinae]MBV0913699.1 LysR family transcriptional regulator [Anianabacter salinae]
MAETLNSLDWSLVQSFLAVAETGSLSGAARRLGISQPTVGRQVLAMEEALGATLFHRQPRGMALSDTGAALLIPARAMQEAAGQMALAAAGGDAALSGTVRITASLIVSHYHLPEILEDLKRDHPRIEIELVPSDTTENLLFREADIALRMYRPTQLDMVTRHVGDIALGIFAARSYLDRHGRPETTQDFTRHQVIGGDRNDEILTGLRAVGIDVGRSFFGLRCDNYAVAWELVRAGVGIGFGQVIMGRKDPAVEQILPQVALPVLPLWLTAHERVRRVPRVALVWDRLADRLGALVS